MEDRTLKDITDPRIIKLKGVLFLVCGALASLLLIARAPSIINFLLLVIAIWSFARFYYFAFYVIQHYVDPGFRFAGLMAFFRYLMRRSK